MLSWTSSNLELLALFKFGAVMTDWEEYIAGDNYINSLPTLTFTAPFPSAHCKLESRSTNRKCGL